MTDVLDAVRRTIRRYALATSHTRVVVALSGGSDSVALAHILRLLDEAGELRVAGVAHFNHQLRPAASTEEDFCREVAASIDRPFLVDREDVAARARRERRSIEHAARTARHAFFERARIHFEADAVALGHTRDDQAETFLLRLLRGAGPRGLASMHPRRGTVIRPLLACRRGALRAFLDTLPARYVVDESNDDVTIPRNRVRVELLPFLQRFNPAIVDVLADEAEIAREAWAWMDTAAADLFAQICTHDGPEGAPAPADAVWRLDVNGLAGAPVALARLVVHEAMTRAARGRPLSFAHVDATLQLSRGTGDDDADGGLDAPGHRVQRNGATLVLRSTPADTVGRQEPRRVNFFKFPLSIPGEVDVLDAGCVVSAEEADSAPPGQTLAGSGPVAIVRRDRFRGPLSVRNRRPGDRFRPLGLAGVKKLQDFFVDRKVTRERRDAVPLVVDENDRIVWVGGYAIDEEFRVTSPAEGVLILKLKVLGGPA